MSYWGGFWGGGRDAVGALWVRINRDVPVIGALGDIIEARAAQWEGIAQQIETSFDPETAVGWALDIFGELLGVRRLGLADEAYRRLLQVERVFVLAGASTRTKLVAAFEAWTQAEATEVRSAGRTFEIGGDFAASVEDRLVRLMERAAPGARAVRVYHVDALDLVVDYDADPVGTTTVVDYALNPITTAAPTAERVH
ncbi:MAG: hypothetical protein VYA51_12820 [Planctomycetota bacterium]|nr:hypothetical protein [Planctomycetota bacterium]